MCIPPCVYAFCKNAIHPIFSHSVYCNSVSCIYFMNLYTIPTQKSTTCIEWYQTYNRLHSTAKETLFLTGEKNKPCSIIILSVIKMDHFKMSCDTLSKNLN